VANECFHHKPISHSNETGVRDDFQDRFEQRAKVASAEASAEAGHLLSDLRVRWRAK
jgi:hypothetical protein